MNELCMRWCENCYVHDNIVNSLEIQDSTYREPETHIELLSYLWYLMVLINI